MGPKRLRKKVVELSPPPTKRTRQPPNARSIESVDASPSKRTRQPQKSTTTEPVDDNTLIASINAKIADLGKSLSSELSKVIEEKLALGNTVNNTIPVNDRGDQNTQPEVVGGGSEDSDSLQHVLQSLLGEQGGEESNYNFLGTDELPLGANLPERLISKIRQGEFVDFPLLLDPHEDQQSIIVNTVNGQPSINVKKASSSKITSISQWTDAMLIYGAIYIQAQPKQASAFFKYMDFIRSMSKSGSNWFNYDELFRRVREKTNRSWDSPLLIPFINSTNSRHNQGQSQGSQNRPPPGNFQPKLKQPFRVPRGYCYNFHTPETRCTATRCSYVHKCPLCSGTHPIFRCQAQKKANAITQKSNAFTQKK